jgi:hypothetical protein
MRSTRMMGFCGIVVALLVAEPCPGVAQQVWSDIAGKKIIAEATLGVEMMFFEYGSGPDSLHYSGDDDPNLTLVRSYRVAHGDSVWILPAETRQPLRCFVSRGGHAAQVRSVAIPWRFSDFVFAPGGLVCSQNRSRSADCAACFYQLAADSTWRNTTLPRSAGWGLVDGRPIGNIGTLRMVGSDFYNCFGESCVHLGKVSLADTLTTSDVITGIPTASGQPVWQNERIVMSGLTPVAELLLGESLFEVFEDGSFIIARQNSPPERVHPGWKSRAESDPA